MKKLTCGPQMKSTSSNMVLDVGCGYHRRSKIRSFCIIQEEKALAILALSGCATVNLIDRENDRVAWGRRAGQAAGKAGVGLGDAVFEVAWQAVRLLRSTLARDRG